MERIINQEAFSKKVLKTLKKENFIFFVEVRISIEFIPGKERVVLHPFKCIFSAIEMKNNINKQVYFSHARILNCNSYVPMVHKETLVELGNSYTQIINDYPNIGLN